VKEWREGRRLLRVLLRGDEALDHLIVLCSQINLSILGKQHCEYELIRDEGIDDVLRVGQGLQELMRKKRLRFESPKACCKEVPLHIPILRFFARSQSRRMCVASSCDHLQPTLLSHLDCQTS